MNQTDIEQAGRRLRYLMDLAERYFSGEVGAEVAILRPGERDIFLHLRDHIFTIAQFSHTTETPDRKREVEGTHFEDEQGFPYGNNEKGFEKFVREMPVPTS